MAVETPLLDRVRTPADLRQLKTSDLRQLADELRQETIDAVSVTGGHLGAGLGVVELTVALHYVFDTPKRPRHLGRRPPGLSAQDPDRPARPHPHAAAGRRAIRLHQARRERIRSRSARRIPPPPFRPGSAWRWRATSGAATTASSRHRRRRHVGRHGLRGDEQCRRAEFAPDRHPERQRHVDRAAGRGDGRLSGAALLRPRLSLAPRHRQATGATAAERSWKSARSARRNTRAAWGPAARSSRSSASTMSARSTGTISTICCRC